jgi:3-isopropylmalate dehydrogenase
MILSAALLLRHVYSLDAESSAIESAVEQVLEDGLRTSDLARNGEGTVGTAEMGTAVAAAISHAEVGTDV